MDIDKLIKYATLDKAGAAKEAYRAIKAELLLNNSSKTPKPEGKIVNSITFCRKNDDSFDIEINELDLSIIKKIIKEREEQISMYEANSRKDLADMYREQRDILKVFLPPEISRDKIQEAVTSAYPNGFTQKEMGKVIKEIKEIYPTADGKLISEVVKSNIV
jgi:uncharacterized protein YqeY